MLHPAFQKQLPLVIEQLQKHKIKNAYVFGSVVTNTFNEKSDLDLLINFEDGLDPLEKGELMWDLEFALENNLQRDIDLMQESTPRNPYFIKELNQTKQLIYGQ